MEQLGKYKVLGELGRGGFGAVYLCEDNLKQKVAVKVFDPKDDVVAGAATSATSDAGEVLKQRFQDEAITLRTLSSNPYIVDLYDFDETEDGIAYYVMPFLQQSLVNEIGRDVFSVGAQEELPPEELPRRIPVDRTIQVLTQILEAMKTVHEEGLVHRDLKPANILFDKQGPTGKVQVCDFGIAKLPDTEHSQSGVGMGSRNYMSKEQRESAKHVTASSDVYAIGIMTYRMLTGALPDGRFEDPIVYAPGIGQALNDLIIRAMSVDAGERPKDAGVFLKELKAALKSLDDSQPEDETTGTWVEQGESSIRDELKPLREQIEKLLLAEGEVKPAELNRLRPMAMVADVDAEALDHLVSAVATDIQTRLRPIQNFLKAIDAELDNGDIPEDTRQGLYLAGESIGWDRDKIDKTIVERSKPADLTTPDISTVPDISPSNPDARKESGSGKGFGRVIAVVAMLVTVAIGGFWWVNSQVANVPGINEQPATESVLQSEEQNEDLDLATLQLQEPIEQETELEKAARLDQLAWDKAESADTIKGYRDYLSLSYATRVPEATQQIAAIGKAESVANQRSNEIVSVSRNFQKAGEALKDCANCPEMVVLPTGSFQMGLLEGDSKMKPAHMVTINKPIAMGKTEVTFAQYDAFAEMTGRALPGDDGWGRGNRPVIRVSRDDAVAYSKWLSDKTGRIYRLPSESEWEYAARAGSSTSYHFGDSETELCRYANHADTLTDFTYSNKNCSDGVAKGTAEVGSYLANPFGLYDMHGNVMELTEDCFHTSYEGAPVDGSPWTSGFCLSRVLRGGSWTHAAWWQHSAWRYPLPRNQANNSSGFRVVLELDGEPTVKPAREEQSLAVTTPRRSVEVYKDCSVCPEMVVIPAGNFLMGSNIHAGEKPVHKVTIGKTFALSKTEVTFEQYDVFARATPGRSLPKDQGWGRGNRPVMNVNWKEAQAYVEWLSTRTGKPYRLPSESEWEYAARAGGKTTYHYGDDESLLCRYANHADSSTDRYAHNTECTDGAKFTAIVGSYSANQFGLHDMLGNVWEFMQDCHSRYVDTLVDEQPYLQDSCKSRVLRGGGFAARPSLVHSAHRNSTNDYTRASNWGIRLAQDL